MYAENNDLPRPNVFAGIVIAIAIIRLITAFC